MSTHDLSCSECGLRSCYRRDKKYPEFCLTEAADAQVVAEITEHLSGDNLEARMARAAAEVEGRFYCKIPRAQEIIEFAKLLGMKRIGIATCSGLLEEARTFVKILRAQGLEGFTAICKIGSVEKTAIGVDEQDKVQPGLYEAMCNPILQAKTLNAQHTELNVIVGLCVGHDSLFIRYSEAPVTTLVTKDRVLGHNPVAALYQTHSYYRRLLDQQKAAETPQEQEKK